MFSSSNLYSLVPLFPKNRLMFPCSLRYFANVPLFPKTIGRPSKKHQYSFAEGEGWIRLQVISICKIKVCGRSALEESSARRMSFCTFIRAARYRESVVWSTEEVSPSCCQKQQQHKLYLLSWNTTAFSVIWDTNFRFDIGLKFEYCSGSRESFLPLWSTYSLLKLSRHAYSLE